jgi:hypothetical protein
VPIGSDSDRYAGMITRAGRGALHRYYRIAGGTHTDIFAATNPDLVRPILPCFRMAFDATVAWVERGIAPPADQTIPRPATDPVNTCPTLAGSA